MQRDQIASHKTVGGDASNLGRPTVGQYPQAPRNMLCLGRTGDSPSSSSTSFATSLKEFEMEPFPQSPLITNSMHTMEDYSRVEQVARSLAGKQGRQLLEDIASKWMLPAVNPACWA